MPENDEVKQTKEMLSGDESELQERAQKLGLDFSKIEGFAKSSEIYIQDGYNLKVKVPQNNLCSSCFDFVFDHYGDPGVVYEITIRVERGGNYQLLTRKNKKLPYFFRDFFSLKKNDNEKVLEMTSHQLF